MVLDPTITAASSSQTSVMLATLSASPACISYLQRCSAASALDRVLMVEVLLVGGAPSDRDGDRRGPDCRADQGCSGRGAALQAGGHSTQGDTMQSSLEVPLWKIGASITFCSFTLDGLTRATTRTFCSNKAFSLSELKQFAGCTLCCLSFLHIIPDHLLAIVLHIYS